MLTKTVLIVMFASSVLSRNVGYFKDLDEEDQMLFRAAYDHTYNTYETPYEASSYNLEHHQEPIDKLDLLKDGMWALKAKLKEMKAFNKALAANLLSTKLKVKELIAHHMQPLKNHKHIETNEKPAYYQSPPQPSYPQYDKPQSAAPQPAQYAAPQPAQYAAPQPAQYAAPQPAQYAAPQPAQYAAPQPAQYAAPQPAQYAAPQPAQYAAPQPAQYAAPQQAQYAAPQPAQYSAPQPQNTAPPHQHTAPQAQHYGTTQYDYDPYYDL